MKNISLTLILFICAFCIQSCQNNDEQAILELEKSIAEENRRAEEAKLEKAKIMEENNLAQEELDRINEEARIAERDDPEKIKQRIANNERLDKAFEAYKKNPKIFSKLAPDEQKYVLGKDFQMHIESSHDKNEYVRVEAYSVGGN